MLNVSNFLHLNNYNKYKILILNNNLLILILNIESSLLFYLNLYFLINNFAKMLILFATIFV